MCFVLIVVVVGVVLVVCVIVIEVLILELEVEVSVDIVFEVFVEIVEVKLDIDLYLWLEEVEGEVVLVWVNVQNDWFLVLIEGILVYDENYIKVFDLVMLMDCILYGFVCDGMVYNFWQDEINVCGLWCCMMLDSYKIDELEWEIVFDFDQFFVDEDKNWVFKGFNCFKLKGVDKILCFVLLFDGGKDVVINCEFDFDVKVFVDGGFVIDEVKQGLVWIDYDIVFVGIDWGGDGVILIELGYFFLVCFWKCGDVFVDVKEFYVGQLIDVGVWLWLLEFEDGIMIYGVVEVDMFFILIYWLFGDGELVQFLILQKFLFGSDYKGW